jgi:hypothetical protein
MRTIGEQKALGVQKNITWQGHKRLRTLFALTIALGVSTPTLTATTANGIGAPIDMAPDVRALKSDDLARPLGDLPVAASDQDLAKPQSHDAKDDVVATRVEEPSRDDAKDVDLDDGDDLPVTVEIERVCEALVDAANAQSLPVGFFARLIWQESRFDQWARSPAGAHGVAQFMAPTAAEFGLRDRFDPIESVAASARFLRQLRDQFGNLGLAAAAYNAGGGRIRKWLNGQSELPEETRNYVNIITGHSPQRWTVQKPIQVSFALPRRAPCDGVEGLSRSAGAASHDVRLTNLSIDLIEEAEAARRAKIAAARAALKTRHAKARAAKGRKLAITRSAAKRAVTKTAAKATAKVRMAAGS